MPRRQWLAAAMLATGAFLVVGAQLAGAAPDRRGGVFRVGTTGASVQIDPQLSYITTGWWLEYATAAKLYNYTPKGTLVPEVASRFKVTNGGTRRTSHRPALQVRDQPRRKQESCFTRRAVHHRLERDRDRRREGRQQRSRQGRPRRPGAREQADHRPGTDQPEPPLDRRDAVLPGDLDEAAA
jgi:hypothetical protein